MEILLFGVGMIIALVILTLFVVGTILALTYIFAALIIGYNQSRGRWLLAILKTRGYEWMSLSQAEQLVWSVGLRARRLPPWEQVGVIPGCKPENIMALTAVARLLPRRAPLLQRSSRKTND